MHRAYVGLGGNQGDVAATLQSALAALAALPGTTLAARSSFWHTPPWGDTAQPPFLNAVAALDTALSPMPLLGALLAIERAHGRDRGADARRWGPRPLDLDLLLHGDTVLAEPGLELPHPRLHQRAFVLVPLAEIAPDLVVPGRGRVADLRAAVDAAGIEAQT
ncbi:2-amino-4-hydroxy-6-hydroxymethyldihydropteridine diphosphokinase [Arenimonas composti]|uniref:2-amino-4-hydroxy-6- hydroxymethyldihydropteridine diphosphokinase n=1 Tax=Arenimonas composti TaxID=370776 RepID=UPI0005C18F65|nr:2-amino-4-hydroxy-6-hydroxymethyldihydropteridine diphosphokinase [Arenimonas composti]